MHTEGAVQVVGGVVHVPELLVQICPAVGTIQLTAGLVVPVTVGVI